jgi:hypothetical protein
MRPAVVLAVLSLACSPKAPIERSAAGGPAKQGDTAQPIPLDLSAPVARSIDIGRALFVLDQVAAAGTDVVMAHVPDLMDRPLGGYLAFREGDGAGRPADAYLVSFYTRDDAPRVAFEVRLTDGAKPAFQAFDPPKAAPPGFAELARARQLAINAMPRSNQPINPVVLPASSASSDVLVYLLAGTARSNLAVLGQHYRAVVPLGGDHVTSMTPLSNSALEMPTVDASGQPAKAIVVTHVVTDFPLETHVFASLLHKLPIYVGTRRGTWLVDGDRVSFLGEQGP